MGCTTCQHITFNVMSICRCCQLVDSDKSIKLVGYCNLCQVYLCKDCVDKPLKRAHAAVLHGLQWLKNKDSV